MKQREQAHLLWSWSRQPPRSPPTAARRRAPTIERVALLCYPGAGWREVIEPATGCGVSGRGAPDPSTAH